MEYSYSRLKTKLENDFEGKLENMISDQIDRRLDDFKKEITVMVEKMQANKPSVVPPKKRYESNLENPTLSTFMKQ